MTRERSPYWFPAKRYGWGWGLPRRWEGWVVVIGWCVLVVGAGAAVGEDRPVAAFLVMVISTAVLLAICLRTGEPTRWRWGRRS